MFYGGTCVHTSTSMHTAQRARELNNNKLCARKSVRGRGETDEREKERGRERESERGKGRRVVRV